MLAVDLLDRGDADRASLLASAALREGVGEPERDALVGEEAGT